MRPEASKDNGKSMTVERQKLSIASVSTNLPTAKCPENGIFVRRRLAAMSAIVDVRAIRPNPWFPLLRSFDPPANDMEFPVSGVRMFYLPGLLKRMDGTWMSRAIEPTLRRWHKEHSLDLIDAHFGYPTGVGCYRVARRLGVPLFITLRGVEAIQLKDPVIGPQLIEVLSACAGVIAVSHSLRDAAERAGIDAEKIRVIPNAVDNTLFHVGDKYEARRRLGLPEDMPIIISVGNLKSIKGFHFLLPAFAALRKFHPDALLVIVGGPSCESAYASRIYSQIKDLGLQESVRMAGLVPPGEVGNWLRAADVFTLVSSREGCCNSVLEALACGLPTVVPAVGDNERYIFPGKNGFVTTSDIDDIAGKLSDALVQQWDKDHIARDHQSYGWEDVAAAFLDFVNDRLDAISRPVGVPSAV